MKYCENCGKELKDNAKFCNGCGQEQTESKRKKETETIHESSKNRERKIERSEVKRKSQKIETDENQTLEHISMHSKNYFSYLNKNVAFPQVKGNQEADYFGLINFILLSLFTGLTVSHVIAEAANPLFSFVNGIQNAFYNDYGSSNYMSSTFPFVFKLILLFACIYFSYALIIYLFKLIFGKVRPTILGSFNDLFSPVSIGVYISAIVFILSFVVSATSFIIILGIWIPLFLLSASFIGLLWQIQIKVKQRYYVVIGTLVVGFIVNLIFIVIGSSFFG